MKIIVASENPVKIEASKNAFKAMFPQWDFTIKAVSVPSGVSDQPMSEKETQQGAWNRAHNARDQFPTADFWVGIEGGLEFKDDEMEAFACIHIIGHERQAKAQTARFQLPPRIRELIKEGKELGEADDIVFQKENSKQKTGAVGLLTGNVLDRTSYYKEAIILALIPFKNKDLYPASS